MIWIVEPTNANLHNGRMHGEYKMPGGKLVVADVVVHAGRLAQVQISGDFFLEPAEALDTINAALQGLPANSKVPAMVAALAHALDPGVVMFGVSHEAIAVALRRALGDA